MRVMYIAPRYHTNQAAVMRGWKEHGDEVLFVSRSKGFAEDYTDITPVMVPYAGSYQKFEKLYCALKKNDPFAHNIGLRLGYPSGRRIGGLLDSFQPDLVILREKSVYSIACYRQCRLRDIRTLLYNQSPLYEEPGEIHDDAGHRLMDALLPLPRFTPVRAAAGWTVGEDGRPVQIKTAGETAGNDGEPVQIAAAGETADNDGEPVQIKAARSRGESGTDHIIPALQQAVPPVRTQNAWFVPFAAQLTRSPDRKDYCQGGRIRILDVGKFERRKNHLLMLDAFAKVQREIPSARLTIAGQVSDDFHRAYYKEVMAHIAELHLSDTVTVRTNLDRTQMYEEYARTDLYVLPSTGEPAAFSPLEAMAESIPAVSGTGNGTADYIVPGECGSIFRDQDVESLAAAILSVISDPSNIRRMGEGAYANMRQHYQFVNYYDALMQILKAQNEHG